MHLRNVEIFCDVVTRRSFSKAAEAHQVSQSAASQSVHLLEKRLGTELIDRSKRPFELTTAGALYFEGCRKLLDSFRRTEDRIRQLENKVAGRVRVAAIYSVGLLEMDAYLRRFEQLYPQAEIHLEYLHPNDIYARLQDDKADLGIVSFPRDNRETSVICWQDQPMVLVVPPAHRLAGATSVAIGEFSGESFVGFTHDLVIRKEIDRWLKHAKVAVDIVHEFDNIENIKRAVEIGTGVALLPAPTVQNEVEAGSVACLALKDADWQRPLGIVHKRHKSLSAAAGKFVELLHEDPKTFPKNGMDHLPDKEALRASSGTTTAGSSRRGLSRATR